MDLACKTSRVVLPPSRPREVLYPVKIFPAAQALSYMPELSHFPSPPSEQLVSGTHVSTGNLACILYPKSARWRIGKSQSLRRGLRILALLNASLAGLVSVGERARCNEVDSGTAVNSASSTRRPACEPVPAVEGRSALSRLSGLKSTRQCNFQGIDTQCDLPGVAALQQDWFAVHKRTDL